MACSGEELLELLKLTDYHPSKLGYREVTTIGSDLIIDGKNFRYGMSLAIQLLKYNYKELENVTTQINKVNSNKDATSQSAATEMFSYLANRKCATKMLLNPMDVMTVLLNCCDEILRQILTEKLVSVKVGVPIILPVLRQNGSKPMALSWSLGSISMNWPSSTLERKYLTDIPNPIISFIRIGNLHRSKSKLISTFITKTNHAVFYHRECSNASAKRVLSNGSIEAAWYQSTDSSDDEDFRFNCNFFTILNLRGNAKDFPMQTNLLCESSSLVVIMADSVDSLTQWHDEVQDKICWERTKIVVAIVSERADESPLELETFVPNCAFIKHITDITTDFNSHDDKPMMFIEWRKDLRGILAKFMDKTQEKSSTLRNVFAKAESLGFQLEDDHQTFKNCKGVAHLFKQCAHDRISLQSQILPLQGKPLKRLAALEKQIRRGIPNENESTEDFVNRLKGETQKERRKQMETICKFTDSEQDFYKLLLNLKDNESLITLMLIKRGLDRSSGNIDHAFGLENIIFEFGQIIEALHLDHSSSEETSSSIIKLPAFLLQSSQERDFALMAAELLLQGQPLELLNGNASYIPTTWVEDVFNRVASLTRNGKVFVLSVIGVQSSGKSTLLNALFGLNFPTSAGRCTSGLYCHLLPIDKTTVKSECDYLMILDAEGFRAPEYIDTSTERDNEMATFVVGLSDLTIVNVEGENLSEMKDILQIVVYALLRIKQTKHEVDLMPSCIFVHQKVSAPDASDKTKTGRALTLKYLDEMVESSARREGYLSITAFSDVVAYNDESDSFFLPNMWSENPPFATISSDYCNSVAKLKSNLIERIRKRSACLNANDLSSRISDLWNAILCENFVFNFRDTKQAISYQSLESAFTEIEWNFRYSNHKLSSKISNKIMSLGKPEELKSNKDLAESELNLKYEDNFKLAEAELTKLLSSEIHKTASEMFHADFKHRLLMLKEEECRKTKEALKKVFLVQTKILGNIKAIQADEHQILTDLARKNKKNLTPVELSEHIMSVLEKNFLEEKQSYEASLDQVQKRIHDAIRDTLGQLQPGAVSIFDKDSKSNSEIQIPEVNKGDIEKKKGNETQKSIQLHFNKILKAANANEMCNYLFNKCKMYIESLNGLEFEESQIKFVFERLTSLSSGPSTFSYKSLLEKKEKELDCEEMSSAHQDLQQKEDETKSLLSQTDNFESWIGIRLKEDFLDKYFAAIAVYTRNKLISFQKDFIQRTDVYCIRKRQMEDIILRCEKPGFMLATHIADEIEKTALGNLNSIVSKLFQYQQKSLMTKKAFVVKLLTDFTQQKDFTKFLKFFTDFDDFCEEQLANCIELFLKDAAIYSTIKTRLKTDTKALMKKVQNDISSSFNEGHDRPEDLLQAFRSKLDGKITFCPESALVYFAELKEYYTKSKSVGEIADQLIADLDLVAGRCEIAMPEKLDVLIETCAEEIYGEKISGCPARCPFCSAPCLEQRKDHSTHIKHHSLHYPVGVRGIVHKRGWLQEETKTIGKYQLVGDCCPALIQSNKSFRSDSFIRERKWFNRLPLWLGWNSIKYRDYQKKYSDWQIPLLSAMGSHGNDYWKWLMANFGEEFAKKHHVKCAIIKDDWNRIKPKEAASSICVLLQNE